MSSSRVLTQLWGEAKGNFEAFLENVKKRDKLPSRRELVEHQAKIQDIIDVFVAVGESSANKSVAKSSKADAATVESGSARGSEEAPSLQKLTRRRFTQDEVDRLWSVYTQNHMQYLSSKQIKALSEELDRTDHTIHGKLRALIAAHRSVPVEQALDNAFTSAEDARVWDAYTSQVGDRDSCRSEGSVVAALAREMRRPSVEVQNRLLWLKDQQNHHGPPATANGSSKNKPSTSAATTADDAKPEQQPKRPYTDEENATILQVCEDGTMTHRELAKHLGRRKYSVLEQYYHLKRARDVQQGGEEDNEVVRGGVDEVENSSDLGSGVRLIKVKTEPGLANNSGSYSRTINSKNTVPTTRPHTSHSISYASTPATSTTTPNTTTTPNNTDTTNTTPTTTPYSHTSRYYGQPYSPQEDAIILQANLHPFRTSSQRFEEVGLLLGRSGSAVRKHVQKLFEEKNVGIGEGSGSEGEGEGDSGSGRRDDNSGIVSFRRDSGISSVSDSKQGVYTTYSTSYNDTANIASNNITTNTSHASYNSKHPPVNSVERTSYHDNRYNNAANTSDTNYSGSTNYNSDRVNGSNSNSRGGASGDWYRSRDSRDSSNLSNTSGVDSVRDYDGRGSNSADHRDSSFDRNRGYNTGPSTGSGAGSDSGRYGGSGGRYGGGYSGSSGGSGRNSTYSKPDNNNGRGGYDRYGTTNYNNNTTSTGRNDSEVEILGHRPVPITTFASTSTTSTSTSGADSYTNTNYTNYANYSNKYARTDATSHTTVTTHSSDYRNNTTDPRDSTYSAHPTPRATYTTTYTTPNTTAHTTATPATHNMYAPAAPRSAYDPYSPSPHTYTTNTSNASNISNTTTTTPYRTDTIAAPSNKEGSTHSTPYRSDTDTATYRNNNTTTCNTPSTASTTNNTPNYTSTNTYSSYRPYSTPGTTSPTNTSTYNNASSNSNNTTPTNTGTTTSAPDSSNKRKRASDFFDV